MVLIHDYRRRTLLGTGGKGFTAFLEPIGIFFAIMLASCVGFFFEVKANRAFDVLNTVNDDIFVKVIREGNICQIPRKEVVVGDIVVLETGEEVPADGHLLEAISLQINESTLTGEPIISKTTNEADFDEEATYRLMLSCAERLLSTDTALWRWRKSVMKPDTGKCMKARR